MGNSFLKLQEMYSFSQNVCIEVYGILNTGATPIGLPRRGFQRLQPLSVNLTYLTIDLINSYQTNTNLMPVRPPEEPGCKLS